MGQQDIVQVIVDGDGQKYIKMIELLKYLAKILEPEQVLEVAHIVSKHPEVIDQETFMELINAVEGFELHEIDKSQYDHLKEHFERTDNFKEMDKKAEKIRQNSAIYKLLKDNNISLN